MNVGRSAVAILGLSFVLAFPNFSWSQLTVTDGLSLWLDATDASTLFKDEEMSMQAAIGDEVLIWADKSGNDYHAVSPFDGPFLDEAALGGQDALFFSGGEFGAGLLVDDRLEVLRPYSIFIAQQNASGGRTLQSATTNWLHGSWSGSFANFAGGFVGSVPVELERPAVIDTTGTLDGDSTFFINNFDATTDPAPFGSPGQLGLGSAGQFAGEAANALVSEVIVYDRVLSAAELASVRDYMYNKYSITDLALDFGAENNTVLFGEVGAFSGGDEDEGLDLTGDFAYALNIGGFDAVVGDAEFVEATVDGGAPSGVTITNAVNELPAWFQANFGDSENDLELATVAGSIRFGGDLSVDLDVEAGQDYKLQLLFTEACCDRGFDVTVEDQLVVDNLHLPDLQNGVENSGEFGAFYVGTFKATDDQLNIHLGGQNPRAADNLPTLAAVTLERVENSLLGDLNNNSELDIEDIDLLAAEVRAGSDSPAFDLDGDGAVDNKDHVVWVSDLANTFFGDSNLDGEFNSSDFVQVFQLGEYEDAIEGNSGWAEGDWNGDGDFNSGDFVLAFQDGGFELGPRGEAAAVPEPSSYLCLAFGLIAIRRIARSSRLLRVH